MRFGIEQMQVGLLIQHARTLMPASLALSHSKPTPIVYARSVHT